MNKKLISALLLGTILSIFLTGPVQAVECLPDVEAADHNLKTTRENLNRISEEKKKPVETFLADAEKTLEKAKQYCQMADSPWEILNAKAMALVSQANSSAAHLLIKEALLTE